MLKLLVSLLLNMLLIMPITFASSAPDITAQSAVVIEASTGKILYGKNARAKKYPASTTKIMTLITALEYGKLDELVTADERAVNTEGSTLWLALNEQMKLRDLLYGIMLVSGNDATVAVANHIAGSVEKYARLMTDKAHEIGAKNTNFTNTSGLPDENHYSTAYDLALITSYGYKNPQFVDIVSTKHKVIPWPGKSFDRELYNENKLLWEYEGANGVKTGYTESAGRCLVSAAVRNGVQIIAVVLDSEYMWEDSIKLLDYGFSKVDSRTILKKGDVLKTVRVFEGKNDLVKAVSANDVKVPVSDQDKNDFYFVLDTVKQVEAPVLSGQKIGTIKIFYREKMINTLDLVAETDVKRKSLFEWLWLKIWGMLTFMIRFFA